MLGPFEVTDGTAPLALGGRKPRALLARLALEANRTVAVQRLVDDLWGDEVPDSAPKMVQIYVSQLRKVLPEGVLRTRAPGYAIEVAPEAVDATRFAALRAEGRAALAAGDPQAASERLREALALWRGPALAEFSEPFAGAEAAHLEELRLVCLEERIEADIACGRQADVVGELEALVARHPLRESLHRHLTLALYRAGRQADALAAYERFRRRLDEELGIEPSPLLKALQLAILKQDSSLEIEAPRRNGSRAPRRGDRFVGRERELGRLVAALGAAEAGAGTTCFVAGPAGIGKTRLTAELAEVAGARGVTVLSGRCIQLVGTGLPYLPFVDAMRAVCEWPDPGTRLAAAGSRLALFEEVLRELDAVAPALIVLEDLQWADASTLDLVAFLDHAIDGHRLLVVGTYRSEEVHPGDPVRRIDAETLVLEPLSPGDIGALLAARSETPISAELRRAIAARSEGNPLFARELLAASARGETAVPEALRDLLLGYVARLGPDGRTVLRVAAAAGRDASYGLLAAVVPLGELELAGALREAVEHDVLVPDQLGGTFRFRHALFAEAVYGTLLPGEREVLHERLARALTEEPLLATSGAAAGEAAHHWVAAGRPAEALEASLRAAREAERVAGLTEALRHVERVLELWAQVPAAEELSGVALPSVLAWAAELGREDGGSPGSLAIAEARRLYPTAVVLESLAVQQTRAFDEAALDALRAANERLRAAAGDPEAASTADDDFHRALTAPSGNAHLLAALEPIKQALLRYEQVYMREPERVERSVAQHAEIIEALERGDHAGAAQLLRQNLGRGLPDLRAELEG
ncbi:MAG TPA: BTAD domain-containing putative transcriptional regulator [Solirubrobacteraceae bacterium]|nr:BTAD domain-containing putative transcriptional regulator [Solirubrobacteraceae bacterium]